MRALSYETPSSKASVSTYSGVTEGTKEVKGTIAQLGGLGVW